MLDANKFQLIADAQQLSDMLRQLEQQALMCFDTEFVSEDCFQPDLCLVQVASSDQIWLIDPQRVETAPFWELLARGNHVTVAHAAREEYRFCHRYTGQGPANLFDTQVGAALIALEYPAAYSTLVQRFAGDRISKGETRTNWRKRPLSESQLIYAARDVQFLAQIHTAIMKDLQQLQRVDWMKDEMSQAGQRHLDDETGERWRRVSGIANLKPQELAIVRNLFEWRYDLAEKRNQPPRRILRDDLIVELARLKSSEACRIKNLRGMNFSRHSELISDVAQQVQQALDLPKGDWPKPVTGKSSHSKLNQVIQFAHTALGIVCRREQVAPALVGTMQDLRDLVAWRLNLGTRREEPKLARGWRKQVVGDVINDLLDGKVSIKVTDPLAEFPLEFDHH